MRFENKQKALELMDALLAEGFTVKMWAYRIHSGKPSDLMDKRTWDAGCAYELVVHADPLRLSDAIRAQTVAASLGLEAWISNDNDGQAAIKIELDFKKK